MAIYIVKIERSDRQVRVTIPKILADQAGLRGRWYCRMEITPQNTIEVSKIELESQKEGSLQENPDPPDRSA